MSEQLFVSRNKIHVSESEANIPVKIDVRNSAYLM